MLKMIVWIFVSLFTFSAYIGGAFHQKVEVATVITQLCNGFKKPELTPNENDGFSVHLKCTEPAKWRRSVYLVHSDFVSVDKLDKHCRGKSEVMTYVGDKLTCQQGSFSSGRWLFG